MLKDITIGQYYPGKSIVHKLDPRIKIILTVLYIVMLFCASNPIGLAVGMAINLLIFPYDNSRQIRKTVQSLDTELIRFLEELFDGDTQLPKTDSMRNKVADMRNQLQIFENQKLLTRRKSQSRDIETFHLCADKARELVARMEVLSCMERPGRLDDENRKRLEKSGAEIRDARPLDSVTERDVVTNYHVRQLLRLRRELLKALER